MWGDSNPLHEQILCEKTIIDADFGLFGGHESSSLRRFDNITHVILMFEIRRDETRTCIFGLNVYLQNLCIQNIYY